MVPPAIHTLRLGVRPAADYKSVAHCSSLYLLKIYLQLVYSLLLYLLLYGTIHGAISTKQ